MVARDDVGGSEKTSRLLRLIIGFVSADRRSGPAVPALFVFGLEGTLTALPSRQYSSDSAV